MGDGWRSSEMGERDTTLTEGADGTLVGEPNGQVEALLLGLSQLR